jgi:hypothetical protein
MDGMKRVALVLTAVFAILLATACHREPKPPNARAQELRSLGIAQLENEDPAAAEETFRQLAAVPGSSVGTIEGKSMLSRKA